MMLKLGSRIRAHFVTLIEIRVHLISVNPGHIDNQKIPLTKTSSRPVL